MNTELNGEMKEQYEKNEKFVGHFLSEERTCAKKGIKRR